ncbi:hypothetical protein GCM10011390_31240 [Aureimonas endophytica]|uniref:Transglycosylase SLT domain-containing protein n=1 Tax=Aureimonas endophytica TaxID=2027858 RepID=A0A916ZQW2_9HYPH|nr:transglycosylase SLT domain-containing protein [Aureimonas endophytica]GGE09950.1 hypothetical protein GCM10011390_31240 [Aureimonas endophytica]
MKAASLAAKPQTTPTGGPDAYGYAPARLAALADGARIALPSTKPDLEKLKAAEATAAAQPAAAPKAEAKPLLAAKPAAAPALDEVAALKADVEERRASLTVLTEGKADRVQVAAATTPAAPAAPQKADLTGFDSRTPVPGAKPTEIASAKDLIDPRKSVPAAISAVAHSADAVKVAAIDTTSRAIDTTTHVFNAVQDRIGDTFKGTDTITGSAAMDQMIERSAAENNIPPELAYAVVRVESHYNPTAIGGGAYGLSQIKPATARGLGFAGPAQGLFDPATNLRYGMKYLAGAWEMSGHDVCGTAMRYKGGHRTTVMTRSASTYCSNVKRHMAAIQRRRAPANHETLVAAAERTKQIAVASRPVDARAHAGALVAANGSTGTYAFPRVQPLAAGVSAPSLGAIRAAAPLPASAAAKPRPAVSDNSAVASADGQTKGGRVRVFADGEAANSTVSADGRFGYAE